MRAHTRTCAHARRTGRSSDLILIEDPDRQNGAGRVTGVLRGRKLRRKLRHQWMIFSRCQWTGSLSKKSGISGQRMGVYLCNRAKIAGAAPNLAANVKFTEFHKSRRRKFTGNAASRVTSGISARLMEMNFVLPACGNMFGAFGHAAATARLNGKLARGIDHSQK